ncbi:hypothetical protein DTO013E5_1989 [Penicillium roqueforti]|uniref:Acyl-CoA N-acyltransferase n=1 Tax=Penicillium roqueforti (strain FM164) TaxID=1365484 RepID=W6QQG4_PENRF|nr:hypothetical protein CBS147372_7054 [Penicillium roqueforti]CDM31752.1 Acyl-CoA N-acyltransferase [Penicillium roqueforti FM164]KAI2725640.1 hypothetical protein CBS147354_4811 [Penicillium roqueforti]KAI2741024.1 hypothetical protein DTO012A1_4798 [Penicillium roqueforti]KAI2749566.1 hypothetical protein DTO013F2_5381 [Penicillium roqueforti]
MSTTVEGSPSYSIETFTQSDLLKQPFLQELQDVINASYYDTGASSYKKSGLRLKSDTQLADELQETGFTAIAFAQNSIIGTASLKISSPDPEDVWKFPGYSEQFTADEIFSASSAVLDSSGDKHRDAHWKGGFELVAVAIKPDPRYRRKGIAECLIRACEEELKRRMALVGHIELSRLCITLRSIREIQGAYWLKRGFRVVGEQYYPPFTWGYNQGFVLWAMERQLSV